MANDSDPKGRSDLRRQRGPGDPVADRDRYGEAPKYGRHPADRPLTEGRSGQSIGCGETSQMSRAYCLIVRSLENLPMAATFRMDVLVHAAGSRYVRATRL